MSLFGLLVTMGIVFGDIGTSPLYVMKAIVGVTPDYTEDYITGAVSCIIWTLTLQTTFKYVVMVLRADNHGEGGILALFALIRNAPRKWLYVVAATGAAALIADGVITPAITVTSAIEGLDTVVPDLPVMAIAITIIVLIFVMQQAGTHRIGRYFGPFMLVWFITLGVLGVMAMIDHPAILKAFNPWYAIKLLVNSPGWFLILGAVFLCTTGAEALYSDLGHCGRRNITVSWFFVKMMLILNYLGQGAWLISHNGEADYVNPFYAIMPQWFLVPGVVLATGAAIIASQALLSGSFTLFSEAMNLGFWPKIRIKYPSLEKGQLYIPAVNYTLLAGCLLTVIIFGNSSRMEAAYGLAITVTMLMTTMLMTVWLRMKGMSRWICAGFMVVFGAIEGCFFVANMFKFHHGGWFSCLIAAVVLAVMLIWHDASRRRMGFIEYRRLGDYLDTIAAISSDDGIPRYASNVVYLSRSGDPDKLEGKLLYSIVNKQPKRADHYWFLHIERTDSPEDLDYEVNIPVPGTVYLVNMRLGFRVESKVSVYLRQVVEDLVAAGKLDLTSRYTSLRNKGIPGDFRFILLHKTFSPSSHCSRRDTVMMQLYEALRHLGTSDQRAFGLDTSTVTVETVPLIINTSAGRRIRPK